MTASSLCYVQISNQSASNLSARVGQTVAESSIHITHYLLWNATAADKHGSMHVYHTYILIRY